MMDYKKIVKNFADEAKKSFQNLRSVKTAYKELPNLFTFSRLGFVPFIIANILSGNLVGAGILTGIASLTDCFDGLLARKLNATSEFGRQLDALIDKIFIVGVALPLSFVIPHLLLPITLDITIAGINGYSHLKGYNPKTSKWGKRKTIFLDSLIASSFFSAFPTMLVLQIGLYFTTILLQIKTGVEYYNSLCENRKKEKEEINNILVEENNNTNENEKTKELKNTFTKKEALEYYKECIINQKNQTKEEKRLSLKKDK